MRRNEWILKLGFVSALLFLGFLGGAVSLHYRWPAGNAVVRGILGGETWMNSLGDRLKVFSGESANRDILASVAKEQAGSLIKNSTIRMDEAAAWEGYTLIVPKPLTVAYLIDMQGRVVHTWDTTYRPSAKNSPPPTANISLTDAEVLPGGDLIGVYTSTGTTPYGRSIVRMDKNSNVVWSYEQGVHHDLSIDSETGQVYTLTHAFIREPVEGMEDLPVPLLADTIVRLSPDGEELERIPVLEAFRDTPFEILLYGARPTSRQWDPLHTNSVERLSPALAARFPMFKPGALLISLRSLNMIAVIDPETKKVMWAYSGVWKGQHDPHFLDNGRILLLDNQGGNNRRRLYSRLIEIDPATLGITWSFSGSEKQPFFSAIYGKVQRLPNGNTLATESLKGRIIEVTPDGRSAWEFQAPRVPQLTGSIPEAYEKANTDEVLQPPEQPQGRRIEHARRRFSQALTQQQGGQNFMTRSEAVEAATQAIAEKRPREELSLQNVRITAAKRYAPSYLEFLASEP